MAVLKKLENKIKLVLIVSSLFLIGCIVISLGSIFAARGMVADAHKKIYVLDGTVPILVKQTTMDETFDVEAKSHIEMFHNLFFTLAPDDKYIDLKENGFYNNIIGTSTICSIFCDSIKLNKKDMSFTYYGRQRIERRTSILMRQLITAGKLRRVPRTENNPHGFLIYNWRTIANKDLSEKQKANN